MPVPPASAGHHRPAPPIGLLISLGIIGPMTIHLVVPALPDLQRDLETNYAAVQLLVSLFLLTFGAAQLFVGSMADMFGRRPVLLAGLSVFAIASVLCLLAPTIEILIGLRMLQGASACVGVVLARTIVRDTLEDGPAARMLGYMATGVAIGPMLAPLAGGLIFEFAGWRAIFFVLSIFALSVLLLAFLFVRETSQVRPAAKPPMLILRDYTWLLRNWRFLLFGLNIYLNTGMFYGFVVGGPYIADRMAGMTASAYGSWFALVALGYALGNYASGRFAHRYRLETVILVGSCLVAVPITALFVLFWYGWGRIEFMFILMAFSSLASGLVMPNSLAGALGADRTRVGTASGIIGFVQFAFAALFSSLVSLVTEGSGSAIPMIVVMLVAALAGIVSAATIWRYGAASAPPPAIARK